MVEVLKDVVMRPAPIDARAGREMVEELKGPLSCAGFAGRHQPTSTHSSICW